MVRIKKRFIIFQIQKKDEESKFNPEISEVNNVVQQCFQKQYGIFGLGCILSQMKIIFWNQEKLFGVYRVPRDWSRKFNETLLTIDDICNVEVKFEIFHVSGTIDKAQKWMEDNNFVIQ